MSKPKILFAASCSVHSCKHGVIHIALHDADGETFAFASLGPEAAADFLDDFGEELETVADLIQSEAAAAAGQQH